MFLPTLCYFMETARFQQHIETWKKQHIQIRFILINCLFLAVIIGFKSTIVVDGFALVGSYMLICLAYQPFEKEYVTELV